MPFRFTNWWTNLNLLVRDLVLSLMNQRDPVQVHYAQDEILVAVPEMQAASRTFLDEADPVLQPWLRRVIQLALVEGISDPYHFLSALEVRVVGCLSGCLSLCCRGLVCSCRF